MECDIYNLLDCSKENREAIDKTIKEKLQNSDESEVNLDAEKTKSENAIKQKYLKEINDYNRSNLRDVYQKTCEQVLCEYAGQTMLLLLKNAEMKDLVPILFSSKER